MFPLLLYDFMDCSCSNRTFHGLENKNESTLQSKKRELIALRCCAEWSRKAKLKKARGYLSYTLTRDDMWSCDPDTYFTIYKCHKTSFSSSSFFVFQFQFSVFSPWVTAVNCGLHRFASILHRCMCSTTKISLFSQSSSRARTDNRYGIKTLSRHCLGFRISDHLGALFQVRMFSVITLMFWIHSRYIMWCFNSRYNHLWIHNS